MTDYAPQFRPVYTSNSVFGHKSLVDKINDFYINNFRDKSLKELKDDFVTTSRNDIKGTITDVIENKAMYASIGAGVVSGILGNFGGAYVADKLGGSHKVIEYVSLGFELLFHGIGYLGTFVFMSKAEGKSPEEIKKALVKTSAIAIPIATIPYPFIRNPLADLFMNKNIKPELATVFSQITLLPLYAKTVKYAIKRYGERVEKYLEDKGYFKSKKNLQTEIPQASGNARADDLEDVIEKAS